MATLHHICLLLYDRRWALRTQPLFVRSCPGVVISDSPAAGWLGPTAPAPTFASAKPNCCRQPVLTLEPVGQLPLPGSQAAEAFSFGVFQGKGGWKARTVLTTCLRCSGGAAGSGDAHVFRRGPDLGRRAVHLLRDALRRAQVALRERHRRGGIRKRTPNLVPTALSSDSCISCLRPPKWFTPDAQGMRSGSRTVVNKMCQLVARHESVTVSHVLGRSAGILYGKSTFQSSVANLKRAQHRFLTICLQLQSSRRMTSKPAQSPAG